MPYETWMRSLSLLFVLNLLLTLIIYISAELGRILGIQSVPLNISIVWPATGFALAALLLYGPKILTGIFLGNFFYNFLHLYLNNPHILAPFITAIFITIGSTLQAYLGFFFIQRYSSKEYLTTFKDTIIFLFLGGILTCMVASSIGVTALYLYNSTAFTNVIHTWITFWVGDSLGIYIITPLIIVWTIHKFKVDLKKTYWHAIALTVSYFAVMILTFYYQLPVWQLFIPMSFWLTYIFRMHGATLGIFLITWPSIILTSQGLGSFKYLPMNEQLFALASVIEIIVFSSLIFAGVINEREAARRVLEGLNVDLKQAVTAYQEEMDVEFSKRQKYISWLELLSLGIVRQIKHPMDILGDYIKKLQLTIASIKTQIDPRNSEELQTNIDGIIKYENQTRRVAKLIQEQAVLNTLDGHDVKSLDVNAILKLSLSQSLTDSALHDPDFHFQVFQKIDTHAYLMRLIPQDLIYAFFQLLNYSIFSMKQKSERLNDYSPILELRSYTHDSDEIVIVIRDNGVGISQEKIAAYFRSLIKDQKSISPQELEMANEHLELSLAYDIIVHVHEGTIQVSSNEGEFLHILVKFSRR